MHDGRRGYLGVRLRAPGLRDGGGAGGSPCEREVRAAEAELTAVHENGDERA